MLRDVAVRLWFVKRGPRGAVAISFGVVTVLAVVLATVRVADDQSRDTLVASTAPDEPRVVDPADLPDGWYLTLRPLYSTLDEAVLFGEAKALALTAAGLGYSDVRIVRAPGTRPACNSVVVCIDGTPPRGFHILLRGPYSPPEFEEPGDVYAWRQPLQEAAMTEAAQRGLAEPPSLQFIEFSLLG